LKTLKIAVAGRELEGPPRGVARWLTEVLASWRSIEHEHRVLLYLEGGLDHAPSGCEPRTLGPGPGGGATAWEQVRLARALRRDRVDVALGPANSLPLAIRTPAVMVLHDLSFEVDPGSFSWREGLRRRLLARLAARRARRVIVVSAFTASEVGRLYRVPRSRIDVIPNGVPSSFRPIIDRARLEATRRRHDIDGDVVLMVGSLFDRRHVPELIAGFAAAARDRPALRLVIVGDDRTSARLDPKQLLVAAGIHDRTRWIERVSEADLLDLYSLAGVTVYLSDYEGFGLPPLEALACGSPVLASATSALEDNLRGRATLLAPDEHTPEAIARSLRELLATERRVERPSWLDAFSWQATGAAVLDSLVDAAS